MHILILNQKLKIKNQKLFLSFIFTFLFFTSIAFGAAQIPGTEGGGDSVLTNKDAPCIKAGGVCKFKSGPESCSGGSFTEGLCSGPANRQCCIKSSTGGQGSGIIPGGSQTIQLVNPLRANTFEELISRIVNWLLVIGAPILTLFIIIGSFQIMTAGGNPENITKGRHTITYAVIGYALLLLSSGIIYIIKDVLGAR